MSRTATAAPWFARDLAGARHAEGQPTRREIESALAGVRDGLARLRGVASADQLARRATEELCRRLGFDRSAFFAVEGSRVAVGAVHIEAHPAAAAPFLELVRVAEPQLAPDLWETDMVRQRKAILVSDARNDPRTLKLVIEAARTRSYVAAPVAPQGRVTGFFAADRFFARRDVTPLDRDALWAFAEGFAHAYEHVLLKERLRSQADELTKLLGALGRGLAGLEEGLPGAAAAVPAEAPTREPHPLMQLLAPAAPVAADHTLLTRREREVLALMAEGATNAMIAERLVISPGTVKSHVKHILRKLNASNRAEAVSRYLRVAGARGRR
ncbi:MAG: GAF domain-containing protein [Thermoleophilaceae bacterium]|nr:GAF domain-containing protein [Thermoleophilaceae bacterium]